MSVVVSTGRFTADAELVVRSWDPWLAEATGIPEADAFGRPLAVLFPDLSTRGLLARLHRVAEQGTVEVLAPAFHQYLIACAPRTPSTHFARMQQHVTVAPLRAAGQVVGIEVTIEDVTPRLDRERELATQLASPDEAMRLRAARALGALEGPESGALSLTGALGDESWRVRRAAAEGLARRGADAVDALVAAVRERHRDPAVLNAAVSALARSADDVVPEVLGLLDASEADLRTYGALTLGLLEDRRAVPALLRALDDTDANVRFHAIEALGRVRALEAADAVAAVAETRDFSVAFAALDALALIGEPAVAPRLVPLLDDPLLQTAAVEALGHLGGVDEVAPIAALLEHDDGPVAEAASALAALYRRREEERGDGAPVAERARAVLDADAAHRLVAAIAWAPEPALEGIAVVLGWLRADGVDAALATLLSRPTARIAAGEALAVRGTSAVPALVAALAAEDAEARKAAAGALGRVGSAAAVPALAQTLADEPEVAVVAAAALGAIGDGAALEPLLTQLGHAHAAVRQAVVAALGSIGHPELPERVRALLRDPLPQVREGAVKLAGYFAWPECLEPLLALVAEADEALRRTAVEQLAHYDDARARDAIASALRDGPPGVRAAAARALAHLPADEALPRLLEACGDADPWVRYYAARSAGWHAAPEAVPVLGTLATRDPLPPVRIAAIDALGAIGSATAGDALRALTDDPDPAIAGPALAALARVSGAEASGMLAAALASPERERQLAALEGLAIRADARIDARIDAPVAARAVARLAATATEPAVRTRALDALVRIGGADAVRALLALSADPRRREQALHALARVHAADVVALAEGLRDDDPAVRRAVVEALARVRHDGAATHLARAAQDDPDPAVRRAAERARAQ